MALHVKHPTVATNSLYLLFAEYPPFLARPHTIGGINEGLREETGASTMVLPGVEADWGAENRYKFSAMGGAWSSCSQSPGAYSKKL